MSKKAHILALKADGIAKWLGQGFGIQRWNDKLAGRLLTYSAHDVWIGSRPMLEVDPTFWQPIPYIIVRSDNMYLVNVRAAAGNESRLHDKMSMGYGGHVDASDAVIIPQTGAISLGATLRRSARREIVEELGLSASTVDLLDIEWTHVIHSTAKPVDTVHLGLVAEINLDQVGVSIDLGNLEYTIGEPRWMTLPEIVALTNPMNKGWVEPETWTRLWLMDKVGQPLD